MLTFVSGRPSQGRDKAVVAHRDQSKPALFFIDDSSRLPEDQPDAPVIDLWRNGDSTYQPLSDVHTQFIRLNHDTDQALITRAVSRALSSGIDVQIIVMYDATAKLFQIFPALRAMDAILAANPHLNAAEGDRVVFTRGGSFAWRDYVIEAQTATLVGDEELDIGVVDEALTQFDY